MDDGLDRSGGNGVSLWQRLDETILAALRTAMSAGGDYETLLLRYSELGEIWQPEEWKKPALIVYSRDVRMLAEEHGGNAGDTHATARYGYVALCVADGDSYAEARAAAQELRRRMVIVLRQWPALLTTATALDPADEEQARRLVWRGATLRVEPRTSKTNRNDRSHWAVTSLAFDFESRQ